MTTPNDSYLIAHPFHSSKACHWLHKWHANHLTPGFYNKLSNRVSLHRRYHLISLSFRDSFNVNVEFYKCYLLETGWVRSGSQGEAGVSGLFIEVGDLCSVARFSHSRGRSLTVTRCCVWILAISNFPSGGWSDRHWK